MGIRKIYAEQVYQWVQVMVTEENLHVWEPLNYWIPEWRNNTRGSCWPLHIVAGPPKELWPLFETGCWARWTAGRIQRGSSYVLNNVVLLIDFVKGKSWFEESGEIVSLPSPIKQSNSCRVFFSAKTDAQLKTTYRKVCFGLLEFSTFC